jgi:hypothetical protein
MHEKQVGFACPFPSLKVSANPNPKFMHEAQNEFTNDIGKGMHGNRPIDAPIPLAPPSATDQHTWLNLFYFGHSLYMQRQNCLPLLPFLLLAPALPLSLI